MTWLELALLFILQDPDPIDAIHTELQNRDPEAAVRLLEKLPPGVDHARGLVALGRYFIQSKQSDRATPYLRRLCADYPHLSAARQSKDVLQSALQQSFALCQLAATHLGRPTIVISAGNERSFELYVLTGDALKEYALGGGELPPLSRMTRLSRFSAAGESRRAVPERSGVFYILERIEPYAYLHGPFQTADVRVVSARTPRGTEFLMERFPDAQVALRSVRDSDLVTTDARGLGVTRLTGRIQGYVRTPRAEGFFEMWSESDREPEPAPFACTDRPVYKPGDVVRWRVIGRARTPRGYTFTPFEKNRIEIALPTGAIVDRREIETGEFGTAAGDFRLADEPPLGRYRILVNGEKAGEFKVQAYRKPDLKISSRRIGEKTVEIRVEYIFGGPVVNANVKFAAWEVCRWDIDRPVPAIPPTDPLSGLCRSGLRWQRFLGRELRVDEATTQAEGVVRFDIEPTEIVCVQATVTEPSGRMIEYEEVLDRNGGPGVFVFSDRSWYSVGDTILARVVAPPLENVRVHLMQRTAEDEYEPIAFAEGKTNERGEAALKLAIPHSGDLRLRAECRGSYDRIEVRLDQPGPDKSYYLPGETARVRVSQGERHVVSVSHPVYGFIRIVEARSQVVEIPIPEEAFEMFRFQIGRESHAVFVAAKPRLLDVSIKTDRAEAAPRDKIRVTLESTARAEFSLAVVDESIFQITRPQTDIRLHFYGPARIDPGVTFTTEEPRMKVEETPRQYFPDTAHWIGRIVVEGRKEIEIELPDNITRWRLVAVAVDEHTRVGQAQAMILARKPMFVRIGAPRFAVERDKVEVTLVVHSDRPDEISSSLEIGGAVHAWTDKVDGLAVHRVMIDVPEAPSIRLVARAKGSTYEDAMELDLPVRPHGMEQSVYRSGKVERESTAKLELPVDADRAVLEVTVTHSSVQVVADALPYLRGYPYGCVEQTMSRFLPAVAAMRALRRLGMAKESDALAADLSRAVPAGLQRLYRFQHEDGGWGWWDDDATNARMTAYVVSGLVEARRAGFFVSPEVLGRAQACLERWTIEDADLRAYVLYALALLNPALEFGPVEGGSLEGECWLAMAYAELGKKDRAAAVAVRIGEQEWKTAWETASALRATAMADPSNPRLASRAQALMDRRTGLIWENTLVTAHAVMALVEVMCRSTAASDRSKVTVMVNGKPALDTELRGDELSSKRSIRMFEGLTRGENEVKIVVDGAPVRYAASLRYLVLGENIRPVRNGLSVSRTYYRILAEGSEEALEAWSRVKVGEELIVRLSVRAERSVPTVLVEDRLPAGCEALEDEFEGGHCRAELRGDRAAFALSEIGPEGEILSYRVRVTTPGEFHVLPARAFNMYRESQSASSAEFFLDARR